MWGSILHLEIGSDGDTQTRRLSKMRIVIAAPVPNRPEGGVANVIYNTAAELRRRGHEVTCLFREDVIPRPVAIPRFEAVYFAARLCKILRTKKGEFDVV